MSMKYKRFALSALAVFACATLASAQQTACPFNVDNSPTGTGAADALRDGTVLVRYALNITGTPLVAGTGLNAATVTSVIQNNVAKLDVNGNGAFDIEDATVIARVLFGFAQGSINNGVSPSEFRTRVTDKAIKTFIDSGCAVQAVAAASDAAYVDASRFLTQASFGANNASILAFKALNPGGTHAQRASAWLNAQYALPRSSKHFDYIRRRQGDVDAANLATPPVFPDLGARFFSEAIRESFFTSALNGNDQLRQRVAFALSQIMVVSSNGGSDDPYELASYLDMLSDRAFGNVRDLLYDVSLSNAMGRYLDHAGNDGNSATPNENFARELLQLFSVGLTQLNADGSNVTSGGVAVPTYDEDTVKGFARVFTGFNHFDPFTAGDGLDRYGRTHPIWNYSTDREAELYAPPLTGGGAITGLAPTPLKQRARDAWLQPMIAWAGRHSTEAKQLLKYDYPTRVGAVCGRAANNPVAFAAGSAILPALVRTRVNGSNNGTSTQDAYDTLNAAVDNIFCHPTLGPYISKSLIRFLVTSTPTPAYVSRVVAKFNDNGSNVRGDMKAVLTAILTDPEALNPSSLAAADQRKFGKLKEPVLRLTAVLRAFDASSASGRARIQNINNVETGINQAPLQSPSVFNFFHPEFTPPGPISNANAFGPEFEITTTTSIAGTANFLGNAVWGADTSSAVGAGGVSTTNAYRQAGYFSPSGCNPGATPTLRDECLYSDLSPLYALDNATATSAATAAGARAMIDYVNMVLMQNKLSATDATNYANAIQATYPAAALPAPPAVPSASQISTWQTARRNRVKMALWLAVHSPEFQIQR
jgi:uncharacterized protein (DUF1800 family)